MACPPASTGGGAAAARRRRPLLLAALAAAAVAPARADCVMTQDSAGDPNQGHHPYAIPPRPAVPLNASDVAPLGYACPQYANASCCNGVQNRLLYVNFMLLHSYFGAIAQGGCPACEQNLRNLWCAYTCSPSQSDFVTPGAVTNVTNPTSGELTTVLVTNVNITAKYACAIFASCAATQKVKTYAPMNSCEGLLAYQGGTGAIPEGAFLNFFYSGDAAGGGGVPGALALPYHNCCNYPGNFSDPAGGNVSCPCASCAGCCSGGSCFDGVSPASSGSGVTVNFTSSLGVPDDDPLVGFNGAAVGALYGIAALASALAVGLRSPALVARAAGAARRARALLLGLVASAPAAADAGGGGGASIELREN